ncbi:MAG: aspartate kinase, partial [Candidatus Nanopelagicales bacterium]
SYTGSQAGLITDSTHGKARIIDVTPGRITQALADEAIPIVAGFQGVSQDTKDITTLGRGGSDTTAVALAAALKAEVCEIFTDVDGIFTADPRIVKRAHKLNQLAYEEVLELAANGAKILHSRCVEYARRFNVPIHVRSSFNQNEGSWVISQKAKDATMEQPIISGVAHDLADAKLTLVAVPDKPGIAATIFETVASNGVNVDMIVQNIAASDTNKTDVTFTLPKTDGKKAVAAIENIKEQIQYQDLILDENIAKISLVGAGMKSHPGVSANFFRALAKAGVNIEMISTSEIRISVVTRAEDAVKAVQAIHSAFDLDAESEATVHAGTGR